MGTQTNMYMSVHSSTIHNGQKAKTTQTSITEEWIDKLWYMQTMEYYLVMKRNKVRTCAAMWMDLKNIMLSERSRTQPKARIV